MLQARSKSQCSLQYFERQTKAGCGSMTRYTCGTVSSAQQMDPSSASAKIATRRRSCTRLLDGPRRSPRLRTQSEEHTSELQSRFDLGCRLLLEKKKNVVPERGDVRGGVGVEMSGGEVLEC